MPALVLQNVRKTYPSGDSEIVALDRANLEVPDDQILALVGPSGSGKTTLLSIAGGLLSATEGHVVVGGHDITEYSAKQLTEFRRAEVGFVFQTVNLVPFLTARENVMVAAELAGRGTEKATRARADQLLEELGLAHRAENLPAQLSGGERQRVAIARALINRPKVLLADEPTGNLDIRTGGGILDLLAERQAEGLTMVMVTHDQSVAARAHRQVRIVDGCVE